MLEKPDPVVARGNVIKARASSRAIQLRAGVASPTVSGFRAAAESRGEIALVISPIGCMGQQSRNVFTRHDDAIHVGGVESRISSRPLGEGARVVPAADLGRADRQLALRMLDGKSVSRWRILTLDAVTSRAADARVVHHPVQGALVPIIVTEFGEPVVAAWTSQDGVERRYVVPVETPWHPLLKWLLEQALPEYVPAAVRRARREIAHDPTHLTRMERDARASLADLDEDYAMRRAALEHEFEGAQTAASPVRDGLLYGTGEELAGASCGVRVRWDRCDRSGRPSRRHQERWCSCANMQGAHGSSR